MNGIDVLEDKIDANDLLVMCRCVTVFQATSGGEEKWFLQTETERLKHGTVFHQFGPFATRRDAWESFAEKIKHNDRQSSVRKLREKHGITSEGRSKNPELLIIRRDDDES